MEGDNNVEYSMLKGRDLFPDLRANGGGRFCRAARIQ